HVRDDRYRPGAGCAACRGHTDGLVGTLVPAADADGLERVGQTLADSRVARVERLRVPPRLDHHPVAGAPDLLERVRVHAAVLTRGGVPVGTHHFQRLGRAAG